MGIFHDPNCEPFQLERKIKDDIKVGSEWSSGHGEVLLGDEANLQTNPLSCITLYAKAVLNVHHKHCVFLPLEKRCPVLSMPPNGGFKCTDGAYFNSRCEYYCSPGYQLKGDQIVQCMDNKAWSGRTASCVGKDCESSALCHVGLFINLDKTNVSIFQVWVLGSEPFHLERKGKHLKGLCSLELCSLETLKLSA